MQIYSAQLNPSRYSLAELAQKHLSALYQLCSHSEGFSDFMQGFAMYSILPSSSNIPILVMPTMPAFMSTSSFFNHLSIREFGH